MSYIQYPVRFQENQAIRALIDSGSEVNTMTLVYVAKQDLTTWKTSVEAQIIDGSPLTTHDMTSAKFLLKDSLKRVCFFEETFLLADTSMEVVLGMPFLSLSNADVEFAELGKLTWRLYMAAEALPTPSRVEFIDKREFAKAASDENSETFVIHMSALNIAESSIHPSRAA